MVANYSLPAANNGLPAANNGLPEPNDCLVPPNNGEAHHPPSIMTRFTFKNASLHQQKKEKYGQPQRQVQKNEMSALREQTLREASKAMMKQESGRRKQASDFFHSSYAVSDGINSERRNGSETELSRQVLTV